MPALYQTAARAQSPQPDGRWGLTSPIGPVHPEHDPGLRTSVVGGKLEMCWKLGTLQPAGTVNGPWQDLTNAVSSFRADLAAGARFDRVKVEQ